MTTIGARVDDDDDADAEPWALVPLLVVRGRVEIGDQRGRTLGVPTANIRLEEGCPIDDGVYAAVYVRPDGDEWPAAVSVGSRTTFYADRGCRVLEAHLLGFTASLVGEEAEVRLAWYVRSQRTFRSVAELVNQLRRDVEVVRTLLSDWT